MITSVQNQKIKYLKHLANKSFREKERMFICEGIRLVEEAIKSAWTVDTFIYSDELLASERGERLLINAAQKGINQLQVTKEVFLAITGIESPQWVMALIKQVEFSLNDIMSVDQAPVLVLVDGIQDPGNLGTIIRTADAFNTSGIVLLKGTVDLYNPKTLRATMGSLFHLPVLAGQDPADIIPALVSRGINLLLAEPAAGLPVYQVDMTGPVAIVVANEGAGPGQITRRMAGQTIRIPMAGQAESLNVSISAAIILYEASRQRGENYL